MPDRAQGRGTWGWLILFALAGAAWTAAAAEDPSPSLPAPVLTDLKPPSLPGQAAEAADPFKQAVEAYVGRNDKGALGHLKEALRRKKDDDRAKQLLLKVYLRMLREKYEAKQYKDAWAALKEARGFFPAHPDVELLGRSIAQQVPELAGEEKPKRETPAAPKALRAPSPVPAPLAAAAAPAPEKKIVVNVTAPEPPRQPWGRSPNDWAVAGLGAALLAAVGLLVHLLGQNRAAMSQQAALFQELLAREREQRDDMLRKMDTELELVKKLQEMLQLANRRPPRETDGTAGDAGPFRGANGASSAPRAPHADRLLLNRQKKQIMDVLVNLSPPERAEKEESIAAQAQNLYEISPSEAVRFLEGLARDESPLIRSIIVPALAKISTDETLEMLLALRNDKDGEVQRAAYKQLKTLGQSDPNTLLPGHLQKITEALREEVNKGEWIL